MLRCTRQTVRFVLFVLFVFLQCEDSMYVIYIEYTCRIYAYVRTYHIIQYVPSLFGGNVAAALLPEHNGISIYV